MDHQAIAEHVGRLGSPMQYAGAWWAIVLGFLNANAAALGLLIGVIGIMINYHFKSKALQMLKGKTANDVLDSMDE